MCVEVIGARSARVGVCFLWLLFALAAVLLLATGSAVCAGRGCRLLRWFPGWLPLVF